MTLFIETRSLTHADWRDSIEITELRLSSWVATNPQGEQYIMHTAPGPLAKLYGELVECGLRHGWIEPA